MGTLSRHSTNDQSRPRRDKRRDRIRDHSDASLNLIIWVSYLLLLRAGYIMTGTPTPYSRMKWESFLSYKVVSTAGPLLW